MHATQLAIPKVADTLAEDARACDRAGQLTDTSAELLRSSGVVRMLQPKDHGGFEATPREFCEVVMELSSKAPSAGWVAGVIGVHPWQFAWLDERLQSEVWSADPDTWIASPYAPQGLARRVEGGYVVNGRWSFSSGTDHSDWVVLGGLEQDDQGEGIPGAVRHFVLPRSDYHIDHDSWEVAGLRGTGSKDIIVTNAFVPDYRAPDAQRVFNGELARANRPGNPLYAIPFNVVFPAAIAAATLGIAEGVLHRYGEYMETRVDAMGVKGVDHPFRMAALGSATSDLQASRLHVLTDLSALYDFAAGGGRVTAAMHYEARRNQVRAVRRAHDAANLVFRHAGASANRIDNPIQRFHRDLNVAMGHAANQDDTIYQAWGGFSLGAPVPPHIYI